MNGFLKIAIAALLIACSMGVAANTRPPSGALSADDEEEIYSGELRCMVIKIAGEWVRICK